MSEYLIRAQFRGPPGCGNGGYVAGRAALLSVHAATIAAQRGADEGGKTSACAR